MNRSARVDHRRRLQRNRLVVIFGVLALRHGLSDCGAVATGADAVAGGLPGNTTTRVPTFTR